MVNTHLQSNNIQVYGDTNINVFTAPLAATAPTAYPAALPAGWGALGWLDQDAGISQSVSRQETQKFGYQGAALLRTIRSQEQRPWTFTALEENPVTQTLLNPFGSITSVAATASVQTVTITGTPTGGTFGLTSQYGTATGLAYNITLSALATALSAAWGITVTVPTGTPGSSYAVTFPATSGSVSAISASNALTGGSSPSLSVAQTTAGVNPSNTMTQLPVTSVNVRQFVIDLISGGIVHRYWFPAAEATQSGSIDYKADDWAMYAFTLQPYLSALAGNGFWVDLNNNPQLASGLFV